MGGPAVSILFPDAPHSERTLRVRDQIRECASSVEGNDFWIRERPFFVSFGPEYPEELDELVATGLPEVLGWVPRDSVMLVAMCNADTDHLLLAELGLRLAIELRGVINFGGSIRGQLTLPITGPSAPVRIVNPEGLTGILFMTSYVTVNGHYATTHFGDTELLRSWMAHRDFRMVK